MQIHELNSFTGTPSATDYLAIDDGTETNKVPATALGVSTQMTQAEATAGTVTEPRVVSPSVFKASVESLAETVAETREVLVATVASFSSLPQTVTNSNITSDMVVVKSVLGTPSAQTGDWTVTASNGSLTIDGSISGSTSVKLYLMKSRSGSSTTTSTITSNKPTRTSGTSSLSGVTSSLYVAYKFPNGFCTVSFFARSSSDMTQGAVLFTLPSEFRPSENFGGVGQVTNSANSVTVGTVAINSSGQIVVPTLVSTTRTVSGHIEYYV